MGAEQRPSELIKRAQRRLDQAGLEHPDVEFGTPEEPWAPSPGFHARFYKWIREFLTTPIPKYRYAFEEVAWNEANGSWDLIVDGRHGDIDGDPAGGVYSATPNAMYAVNTIEGNNVGSGVQGTGTDTSQDYPDKYNHLPLGGADADTEGDIGDGGLSPNQVVVWLEPVYDVAGNPYYWTTVANADYGACA